MPTKEEMRKMRAADQIATGVLLDRRSNTHRPIMVNSAAAPTTTAARK